MNKKLWLAVACLSLAAASSPLSAQQPTPPAKDSTDTTKAMPMPAGHDMAAEHANMMDVHKAAIAAATQAGVLAKASPLDRAAIATQATTARDDLQMIVKHLQDAEATATAGQKTHMAAVRAHEEEALKHAEELLQAANNQSSSAAELGAHAKAVVDHATAAQKVMDTAH